MFTGIITHIGKIASIEESGDWKIKITAENFTSDMDIGASISCSGVCLTAIEKDEKTFTVQVSTETLSCTTLGNWKEGQSVNLERALKVGAELGGHFVSGHVDGIAILKDKIPDKDSFRLTFTVPKQLIPFIAPKGSVTLDGISLTVNTVSASDFSVNIIPHTLTATTLGACNTGDKLNIEVDIIARYLAHLGNFRLD